MTFGRPPHRARGGHTHGSRVRPHGHGFGGLRGLASTCAVCCELVRGPNRFVTLKSEGRLFDPVPDHDIGGNAYVGKNSYRIWVRLFWGDAV
jgi:hypothetical protein